MENIEYHPSRTEQSPKSLERLQCEEELATDIIADAAVIEETIDAFEDIVRKAKTPEQREQCDLLRKKIGEILNRFVRYGRNLTLFGLMTLSVNHYATHPDLKKEHNENDNETYVHPDAKTTHILNILSGKEPITFEEALENHKEWFKTKSEMFGYNIPSNFDDYDIDQFDLFYTTVTRANGYDTKPGELKEILMSEYQKKINLSEDNQKEIYNLLWKMEEVCGNPKIRFQTEAPFGLPEYQDRAYFDPATNTIYIPLYNFLKIPGYNKSLFAEMSHAKQLKDDPINFYLKWGSSALRTFLAGGFNRKRLSNAQKKEYSIPTSMEHEAHSVIQPELEAKFAKNPYRKKIL